MNTSAKYEPISLSHSGDDDADPNEHQQRASLMGRPETMPVATTTALMSVTAPATLPEGFEFSAAVGGRTVMVKVPAGGVEAGQTFTIPLPSEISQRVTDQLHIPVGHWRDGFFGVLNHGVCHPHMWTACCCPIIAAGQVLARLNLNWRAQPMENRTRPTFAFYICLGITTLYWTFRFSLSYYINIVDPNFGNPIQTDMYGQPLPKPSGLVRSIESFYQLIFWLHILFWCWLLTVTRKAVRAKYAIAEPPGGVVTECCAALWCHWCVAGQMLRHTADYDQYPAHCCSEKGVPSYVPSIV